MGHTMISNFFSRFPVFICLTVLLSSCAAPIATITEHDDILVYSSQGDDTFQKHSPIYLIRDPDEPVNRISTVVVQAESKEKVVSLSPDAATLYAEERQWSGSKGLYRNLIYRVHFQEVPNTFIPFHLTAGSNVGLFIIITLDARGRPLLYTTLHTCGCYLAFIPTTILSRDAYPDKWPEPRQQVYGENLPAALPAITTGEKLHVLIRSKTHRVENIWVASKENQSNYPLENMEIRPLSTLSDLRPESEQTFSFFETEGPRKDYVLNSPKIWERLFISWWALDWRVGEDKRLGKNSDDGIVFYTSLKPWARNASDLRDFASFLDYWGWKL